MGARFTKTNADHHVFAMVAKVVTEIAGIQLGERQRSMVEARLRRRMGELEIKTEDEYLEFFQANRATESQALVSLFTTHHTYFFREFSHFEYLEQTVLPGLVDLVRARKDKKILIWSAASSRGQEAFSLAMCVSQWLHENANDLSFEIIGTDVDPESVKIAVNGVFHFHEIKEIPMAYIEKHWARGTGEISNFVKAKANIRNHCKFWPENLLDLSSEIKKHKFDIIFCRNVFIYFNQDQIKKIVSDLIPLTLPHGHLMIGISESLHGLNLPLEAVGPSIYKAKGSSSQFVSPVSDVVSNVVKLPARSLATSLTGASVAGASNGASVRAQQNQSSGQTTPGVFAGAPLRVLCVDDSKSILALLKQVLKPEFGFEIVGTAINGHDAHEKVKALKPDIMTLDIHMPEQTGIEYLEAHMNPNHPPVIMLTSVTRENQDLALAAFKYGASDYVEKPALADLGQRAEEIRAKLRSAYRNQQRAKQKPHLSDVDKAFGHKIKLQNVENAICLIFGNLSDRHQIKNLLAGFEQHPPTVIMLESSENSLRPFAMDFAHQNAAKYGSKVSVIESGRELLQKNHIYFCDFKKHFEILRSTHSEKSTSIMVLGEPTPTMNERIPLWTKAQILIEDDPLYQNKLGSLKSKATDSVPITSFAYMAIEFLAAKEQKRVTKK